MVLRFTIHAARFTKKMMLKELLQDVTIKERTGSADAPVSGLACHTDDVQVGATFVALRGAQADGHRFVAQAIDAGARSVIVEEPQDVPDDVAQIVVDDCHAAYAHAAARWFAHPSREMQLIGITGTNGKTTLTYLLEAIWKAAQQSCGVIGTVDYRFANQRRVASHTTPDAYVLQTLLREMRNVQVSVAALEVSSHGIAQSRVAGCDFAGAIFTNLTQDHLDYHDSLEAYAATKARLFTELLPASVAADPFAVVNVDDAVGARIAHDCLVRVLRYGLSKDADVYVLEQRGDLQGTFLRLHTPRGELALQSPFVGQHNIYNVLAAVATAEAMGIAQADVIAGLEQLAGVPGRLERVSVPGASVFVDYAHTPDAVAAACAALRPLTRGRLITVMGCGGDRDQAKRPLMGQAAAQVSDVVIVTSDNPRTEDPQAIIDHILPGVAGVTHEAIVDRRAAIARALEIATSEDVVLIAGKGHEDYQIIGVTKHPFDDREVVRAVAGVERSP